MQEKFSKIPISVFEEYAEASNAMHQIALWTAVELDGLGASLQHSHMVPGVEDGLKSTYGLPAEWSIKAELVIGGLSEGLPKAPEKEPVSITVKVLK